jgi:hypothetical protein
LQFTKAVESKQVAQQDAERARFVVMKADQARMPSAFESSDSFSVSRSKPCFLVVTNRQVIVTVVPLDAVCASLC